MWRGGGAHGLLGLQVAALGVTLPLPHLANLGREEESLEQHKLALDNYLKVRVGRLPRAPAQSFRCTRCTLRCSGASPMPPLAG